MSKDLYSRIVGCVVPAVAAASLQGCIMMSDYAVDQRTLEIGRSERFVTSEGDHYNVRLENITSEYADNQRRSIAHLDINSARFKGPSGSLVPLEAGVACVGQVGSDSDVSGGDASDEDVSGSPFPCDNLGSTGYSLQVDNVKESNWNEPGSVTLEVIFGYRP